MPIARVRTKEVPTHIDISISFEDAERLRYVLDEVLKSHVHLQGGAADRIVRQLNNTINAATTDYLKLLDGRKE